MHKVRIISNSGMGLGTIVTMEDGTTIPNISKIRVAPILPDDLVRAEITVFLGELDIAATAILSLESVKEAAALHGFNLIPITA